MLIADQCILLGEKEGADHKTEVRLDALGGTRVYRYLLFASARHVERPMQLFQFPA